MREVAERAKPIVERDQDDVLLGQSAAVANIARARAAVERTPVDPHEHRPRLSSLRCGPHIEKETVFALFLERTGVDRSARVLGLRTLGPVDRAVPRSLPGDDRLRRTPPQIANRRRRVGNASETANAVRQDPGNSAAVDVDYCCCDVVFAPFLCASKKSNIAAKFGVTTLLWVPPGTST